jgi:hypothetical protein
MATSPVPPIPATSLSLDATVFLGKNHVRRAASKLANVYLGDHTNAQDFVIQPGSELVPSSVTTSFRHPTKVVVVSASSPITLMLTMPGGVQTTLLVNQLMMLDDGIFIIEALNYNPTEVRVQIVSLESNDGPTLD